MADIDRAYMLVALVLAVLGMLLGFYMGIAADNRLLTVHIAFVLPGFVTLAIYGLLYRAWPSLKKTALAQTQFWTAVIGSVGGVIGTYLFATSGSVPLIALSSALMIIGAALITWLFWTQSSQAT